MTTKERIKIECTMWRWGIAIYWKDIYVAVGESMEDYDMGFWWNFMDRFANESQKAVSDFGNYEQYHNKKLDKMIIRRKPNQRSK